MPTSTSATTPTEGVNVSGDPNQVDSPPDNRAAVLPPAPATPGEPEWTTKRWKVQVEADARRRLKKRMRARASDA